MKKIHIAISPFRHFVISTDDIDATVADYSARLEAEPCLIIAGEYALWRTAWFGNISAPLNKQQKSTKYHSIRHTPRTALAHPSWKIK